MNKYISVQIPNKDCKGIYFFCDTEVKIISDAVEATKLIKGDSFKLQLRTKINGKSGKKIFIFNKKQKSFLKALELVAGKRDEVRETLRTQGTLREKKTVDVAVNADIENRDTFIERVEKFISAKEISARPATIQNYSTSLQTHSKPLHNKYIDDITLDDVQKIIRDLNSRRAAGTVVLYARTLGVFLKKEKALIYKYWEDLELPEVDNKVEYTLNIVQTKKIIAAMRNYSGTDILGETVYQHEEIKNIFAFLLTGRRVGEVVGLKYTDLDLDAKTFNIPPLRVKGKKKLVFNLDDYLMEAIKSQARLNRVDLTAELPAKKIFDYSRETPRIHFQNLLKALNLPRLRLHDIRHLLASTLLQNGVPISDISVLLGHSNTAVTESRYASTSKDQATRATNALDDIMKGK